MAGAGGRRYLFRVPRVMCATCVRLEWNCSCSFSRMSREINFSRAWGTSGLFIFITLFPCRPLAMIPGVPVKPGRRILEANYYGHHAER